MGKDESIVVCSQTPSMAKERFHSVVWDSYDNGCGSHTGVPLQNEVHENCGRGKLTRYKSCFQFCFC